MEATTPVEGVPQRSQQQRKDALKRANRVRIWRSEAKRDLKAGRLAAGTLIVTPPEQAETMKVFDLLLATPKVGRVKAMKMLSHARVSPSRTLDGLSPRQRAELVRLLPGRR